MSLYTVATVLILMIRKEDEINVPMTLGVFRDNTNMIVYHTNT